MGNHEFCTECGENDFHHGQPCNPEKKQAWQSRPGARRMEGMSLPQPDNVLEMPPTTPKTTVEAPQQVFALMDGRGAWKDVPQLMDDGKLDYCKDKLVMARMPNATTNGSSTVAIRANTDNGRVVIVEITMALFLAAAKAFKNFEDGQVVVAEPIIERHVLVDNNGNPLNTTPLERKTFIAEDRTER